MKKWGNYLVGTYYYTLALCNTANHKVWKDFLIDLDWELLF